MQKYRLLASLILFTAIVSGQNIEKKELNNDEEKIITEKGLDFKLMPFLSYNRNLEFMFGGIPMVMYRIDKEDEVSPKSISGVSAVYTTNQSYFIALFNKFYFKGDKWRATFFMVTGDHNSQFFVDDLDNSGFYDYGTKTTIVSGGLQRQIISHIFGGLTYTYSHYDTVYEDDLNPPSVTSTHGLELNFLADTRDAVYYPKSGNKIKLRWISYPEWFSNDFSSNKIRSEFNKYISVRKEKDVIAARFAGQFGLGDVVFEQQVTIGGKDIRGYSEGKYRGDGLLALQGEYRYNFNDKMGLVGFAGLATIYGSDTASFNWNMYPGIGAGYRYTAFNDVKFNIGLDAAFGKDDWGVYFRIGEAF
ncbi:BamA/TamA family outer membrane protein [Zhouia amylolytica]|uniref:Outer membrane protein/protective antigen OMA87-like protein n=1 Tax=Zhouia amylolytica AD3 TaxID=1286632 RepID=W2UPK3_9FLAO|nr:BamA/TamA family outer membrane protein [Zhouia amylolytica]ETN95923.1 outer membrane protein/protective antigen OMA87-like protein [Zhouia amylolytica AD3]